MARYYLSPDCPQPKRAKFNTKKFFQEIWYHLVDNDSGILRLWKILTYGQNRTSREPSTSLEL